MLKIAINSVGKQNYQTARGTMKYIQIVLVLFVKTKRKEGYCKFTVFSSGNDDVKVVEDSEKLYKKKLIFRIIICQEEISENKRRKDENNL